MSRFIIILSTTLFLLSHSFAQLPDGFGELVHTADLGSQTPTPDRSIVGVQYAAGNLWVTGYDPDDYWQHKLYKFSADGSELLETYSYGIEAAGWNDLAYDGEYLYVTDMSFIQQIDPATGEKTDVTIPAPFYYNDGLAYNPANDHFYVTGEGGSNIYEIDRDGEIQGAIADYANHATSGLAIDTVSPGGPFLWTWSNESVGYNLFLRASQVSLVTNAFTGVSFEGESISSILQETAGGATISYEYATDSVTLVAVNIRNGNAQDQMEYAMFYDITRNDIPGPQIAVNPETIQNTLPSGDSLDIEVSISNNGDAPLFYSAYVQTPGQDTSNLLGDLLFSFNATEEAPSNDNGMNAITFLNGKIWVNGRNYPSQQSKIYEFDTNGVFLQSHAYYSLSNIGYRTITSDGTYLYGEDTYTLVQIDPETFQVEGYILKPGSTFSGLTYDPATDHFWSGNGNGLIYEFDRDGEVVNTFITSYDIQGLAWDAWSPDGPYIWAFVETPYDTGARVEAIRLDPSTCTPTGAGFQGFNFSDGSFQDTPKGAVITNQWTSGKVTLLGLQNAPWVEGEEPLENNDFVGVYDLDVTPPPGWIELMNPAFGTVNPLESGAFTVRLRSIMEDTLMTALIRVTSNDILVPELFIPVNFEMTAFFTAVPQQVSGAKSQLGQNFPNPAASQTAIPLTLSQPGDVQLEIYDLTGSLRLQVLDQHLQAGSYTFSISTNGLSPGYYIYTLKSAAGTVSRRMIIKK